MMVPVRAHSVCSTGHCADYLAAPRIPLRIRRESSITAARDIQNLASTSRGPPPPASRPQTSEQEQRRGSDQPHQVIFRGIGRPVQRGSFTGSQTNSTRSARGGGFDRGRGQGFTRGRGDFQRGRGRGRGRGGGPSADGGPKRRSSGARQRALNDVEGEGTEDWPQTAENILEDNESFESEPEMESYMSLLELIEAAPARMETTQKQNEEGQTKNDDEMVRRAQRAQEELDADIEAGLVQLAETQEGVSPRHVPQDVTNETFEGEVGNVPVGKAGMGVVVEDGLRLLANRLGHEWEDPKKLARRLLAGDFVKFRNVNERNSVIALAKELSRRTDAEGESTKITFAPLETEARKTLVERLVQGQSTLSRDAAPASPVLRNIARLTNGNPTYPAETRDVLLKTIRTLLPAERTAGARVQAPRSRGPSPNIE